MSCGGRGGSRCRASRTTRARPGRKNGSVVLRGYLHLQSTRGLSVAAARHIDGLSRLHDGVVHRDVDRLGSALASYDIARR